MKAYKAFGPDWICRGFQFKVGKTYELPGTPILCQWGFHACLNPADCFKYYDLTATNKFAEVELLGDLALPVDRNSKVAATKIRIVKEIPYPEMLNLINTGTDNSGCRNSGDSNSGNRNSEDSNSGDRNSGDYNSGGHNSGNSNSGYANSGNSNSGNCNSGNRNAGSYNSGDYNLTSNSNGFFNTKPPEYINVFNKPYPLVEWGKATKPKLLDISLNTFINKQDMTEKEKNANPHYEIIGGYLKALPYKDAWANSWAKAPDADKQLLYALPNFDPEVFEAITGIDVTQDPTWSPS